MTDIANRRRSLHAMNKKKKEQQKQLEQTEKLNREEYLLSTYGEGEQI